ncbi:MAG: hypothetical protein J5J06_18345 [Phycisphaerae bacterium]|nr:hypothetical protein [Phycisphaerae bacterium]
MIRRSLVVSGLVAGFLSWVGAARANDMEVAKKMDEVKLTLGQAVEAAEKSMEAQATAATAHLQDGKLIVDVHLMVNGMCKIVPVDAEGKVGEATDPEQKIERAAHGRDPGTLAKLMADSKVTLVDAIKAAEEYKKGRAVLIKARWHGSLVQLQAIVITDRIETVIIDPKTGKVKVPAAG